MRPTYRGAPETRHYGEPAVMRVPGVVIKQPDSPRETHLVPSVFGAPQNQDIGHEPHNRQKVQRHLTLMLTL